jgi:hypothetical protein
VIFHHGNRWILGKVLFDALEHAEKDKVQHLENSRCMRRKCDMKLELAETVLFTSECGATIVSDKEAMMFNSAHRIASPLGLIGLRDPGTDFGFRRLGSDVMIRCHSSLHMGNYGLIWRLKQ